ncbi:MAG: hypothetical protein ACUVQZ_07130 [Candidatus Caldatribacteriaceae bacterium]
MQKALTEMLTPEEALKGAAKSIRESFTPEEYEMYRKMARDLLREVSGK